MSRFFRPTTLHGTALGIGLGLLAGSCGDRQAREDHLEICTAECEHFFECEIELDGYSATQAECIEECDQFDSPLWKHAECEGLAEAYLSCTTDLTCDEYESHYADLEHSLCSEPAHAFSVCLGKNSPG